MTRRSSGVLPGSVVQSNSPAWCGGECGGTRALSGHFLLVANQASGNIVTFKRDLKTGLLTKIHEDIKLNFPSSLKMRQYN